MKSQRKARRQVLIYLITLSLVLLNFAEEHSFQNSVKNHLERDIRLRTETLPETNQDRVTQSLTLIEPKKQSQLIQNFKFAESPIYGPVRARNII